jgi:hypothetical protein
MQSKGPMEQCGRANEVRVRDCVAISEAKHPGTLSRTRRWGTLENSTARRRQAQTAFRWQAPAEIETPGTVLKPYWGKPAVRNFRGGGWKPGFRQLMLQGATALLDKGGF